MVEAPEEDKKAETKKRKRSKSNKKEEEAPRELDFGKRLAHTDKKVRDKGFKSLSKFLGLHGELERFDYLKLWKALYYCMWMSDKRPVQQELIVRMALLINSVPHPKRGLWFDAFWAIMEEAWEKLDRHRLNKFMLFIRIVIAEVFKVHREAGWQPEEMKALGEMLCRLVPQRHQNVVHTGWNPSSLGMLLQVNRILWEELSPQLKLEPKAPDEAVMELLEPFFLLLEGAGNPSMVNSVREFVVIAAPEHFSGKIVFRLLQGAAKKDIAIRNREILYEIVDTFEKRHMATIEAQAKARAKMHANGAVFSGLPPPKARLPAELLKKKKQKKKKKKRKAPEGEQGEAPKEEQEKAAVPSGGQDTPPPTKSREEQKKAAAPPVKKVRFKKSHGQRKWEKRERKRQAAKAAAEAGNTAGAAGGEAGSAASGKAGGEVGGEAVATAP